MAEYIKSFYLQYKSVKESSELLPQPLEGIMSMVREIVQDLTVSYNLNKPKEIQTDKWKKKKKASANQEESKAESDPLIGYVQISVEKYLFTKIYECLFKMYTAKFEEKDNLFLEWSYNIKILK